MPHQKKITSITLWLRSNAANNLRGPIVDVAIGRYTQRTAARNFKIKGRELKSAVEGINKYELVNKYELQYNSKYRSTYRWISDYTGAKCIEGSTLTKFELHKLSYKFIVSDSEQ